MVRQTLHNLWQSLGSIQAVLQSSATHFEMTHRILRIKDKIYFFNLQFPARNIEQRDAWITSIGRKNQDNTRWVPKKWDRVCSRHFVNGTYSGSRRDINYVPTLELGPGDLPIFDFQMPAEPDNPTTAHTVNNNTNAVTGQTDEELQDEPKTKEIEIQCDMDEEEEEEIKEEPPNEFNFECQFIGLTEKGTQMTSTIPFDIKEAVQVCILHSLNKCRLVCESKV